MKKMRSNLAQNSDLISMDIITYGCNAHIFNLLSKDLKIKDVIDNVKIIVKHFRNNHFSGAKYKMAGGRALNIPIEVRWNTVSDMLETYLDISDMLETYLDNWCIMAKVCNDHRAAIDGSIILIWWKSLENTQKKY